MLFKVTAPLKQFTGKVVGVEFRQGRAEVDTGSDFGRAAYAYFNRHGYRLDAEPAEPQDNGGQVPPDDGPFNPSGRSVDDVLAHVTAAPYEEAVRVLDAEAAGKNRVTITGKRDALLADKQPTTPPAGDDTTKEAQQ